MLDVIQDFINEMNEKNTTTHKKQVLEKYKTNANIRKLLVYVYAKDISFYCTSKSIQKFRKQFCGATCSDSLFQVLDCLRHRQVTGNEALQYICSFLETVKGYEEIFYRIIDKNLKIRVQQNIIDQVDPDLFPKFHVALANRYDSKFTKDGSWFLSRKLDGVRCIVFVNKMQRSITCYSRMGKQFHTLQKLEKDLLQNLERFRENVYLDGEIVQFDDNGKDNFKEVMQNINRKNHDMEIPLYHIFDCIPESDFRKGASSMLFLDRQKQLKDIFSKPFQYCHYVTQFPLVQMEPLLQQMKDETWEGVMVRKNGPWEGKRSNSLLKIKTMHDEEFRVVDVEMGPFRYLDKKEGKEKEKITLSSVIIDYRGTRVGSGFSMKERDEYYRHPEKILQKKITVQYFEKTAAKLRFPVFKGVRDDFC